ncbi:hypothetical protein [Clostridium culturomicium]|uniref:hypothetical protein n=1 Tax=Clostridium culturomicium TaxID=1499683 RepID=UPI0038573ACC
MREFCFIRPGSRMYRRGITVTGRIVSFRHIPKYINPKAPNKAGTTLLKAGRTGFCNTGCNGTRSITPIKITRIVTKLLIAMERVLIISFSGVPALACAISLAVIVHGVFKLDKFPVMKAK